MGTYASVSDVQARLPSRTIGASTKPSTTQVGEFIDQGEALLTGALMGADVAVPITDTTGIEQMKSWATDFAEGLTREAYASAQGDDDVNAGADKIKAFRDLLDEIKNDGDRYYKMLWGGATSESTAKTRGYVLRNDDGKTVADDDFVPTFYKQDPSSQF